MFKDIFRVFISLLKIMIPALILVKLLEELGIIIWIAKLFSPIMGLVGLPDSMGIVWVMTMFTNIYTGMVVFFELASNEQLSIAQVTVLGTMMLIAHAFPIEAMIAKKVGVKLRVTLSIRIFGALLIGIILHQIYQQGAFLQQPNQMIWQPAAVDLTLWQWAVEQVFSFLMILLIISGLILLLRILKWTKVENLLHILLKPFLYILGLSKQASNITIIGMLLGLSFGGGLLINETESGKLSQKDIFISMALLAFCHSIIEDTLLILLLGAHLSGILWGRILFGLALTSLFSWLLKGKHQQKALSLLMNKSH